MRKTLLSLSPSDSSSRLPQPAPSLSLSNKKLHVLRNKTRNPKPFLSGPNILLRCSSWIIPLPGPHLQSTVVRNMHSRSHMLLLTTKYGLAWLWASHSKQCTGSHASERRLPCHLNRRLHACVVRPGCLWASPSNFHNMLHEGDRLKSPDPPSTPARSMKKSIARH